MPAVAVRLLEETRGVISELRSLGQLIQVVVATLDIPPTPLDPDKARSAWEAYERGETRPLEPGFLTRQK